jgi:hypothetical protein
MNRPFALFLRAVFAIVAGRVDVLGAILGKRIEAVDSIDAWFRNSNGGLLR